MAFTVITEHPAVRELGDLITVGELGDMESSSIDQVEGHDDSADGERVGRSGGADDDDRENEGDEKEDDEADGEEEDDDTESERS